MPANGICNVDRFVSIVWVWPMSMKSKAASDCSNDNDQVKIDVFFSIRSINQHGTDLSAWSIDEAGCLHAQIEVLEANLRSQKHISRRR